jgi:transcription-repair coupling factor (superfamily II helicase)
MQVTYRGEDTLFVPYEQMDLLHKYIGGEGARLDKLGGSTWAQVTDRVRKRVKALAGRAAPPLRPAGAAPGFAFPPDGEWERELEEGFPTRRPPTRRRPSPPSRRTCRGRTRRTGSSAGTSGSARPRSR